MEEVKIIYQIAICDDDSLELEKTEKMLCEYSQANSNCEIIINKYTSADELLQEISKGAIFDLLLMDVYMPGKNGIDSMRELREKGYKGEIIFITSSPEHAIEAYEVNAVQYILKPINSERLYAALEKALIIVENSRCKYITLKSEGVLYKIQTDHIVFIESQNQYQNVHLMDEKSLRIRSTLSELYTMLANQSAFVRVGSTYIVNLIHVDSLSSKALNLCNGKSIWLPRGSYATLKDQYFNFYTEK